MKNLNISSVITLRKTSTFSCVFPRCTWIPQVSKCRECKSGFKLNFWIFTNVTHHNQNISNKCQCTTAYFKRILAKLKLTSCLRHAAKRSTVNTRCHFANFILQRHLDQVQVNKEKWIICINSIVDIFIHELTVFFWQGGLHDIFHNLNNWGATVLLTFSRSSMSFRH